MENSPLPVSKTQERTVLAGLILVGWAFIVLCRLFIVQNVEHGYYSKLARRQQETVQPIDAPRGTIYDRNGNILAISSTSHEAVVNPKRMPDKDLAAGLLAGILHQDEAKLKAYLERLALKKGGGGYLVVAEHLTDAEASALEAMHLDWLEIRSVSVRTYPNGAVASHVIGNINAQGVGTAGVELKLNKDLSGISGARRIERDGKATTYESEVVTPPITGKSVGLTIDRELQFVAQEALRNAVQESHADHASLVAMNPRTGEILALENYPTYDPNQRLLADDKTENRRDLAVLSPFEPGSVFKIVTLSAALETTRLRPSSLIDCGHGVMRLYSRVIHDSHPHGTLSMADVLAFSSNIGAIKIGMEVGNANLYDYVKRFGFGQRTGVELPGEHPGLLRPLRRWQPTSIGSVPMGHEIAVTSLQLAQMGSVIANGGFLVAPRLVGWKEGADGVRQASAYPQPKQILKPETAMTMRAMMTRVMTEPNGTGHRLHVIGYSLAGKTGTAQIYDYEHRAYTHRYNASFLGFGPVNNPALIVVVTVSGTTGEAGFGGTVAGPVFTRMMSAAMNRLGVVRDVPEEVEEWVAKEDKRLGKKDKAETDSDTAAELTTPFTPEEMRDAQAAGEAIAQPVVSVESYGPKTPNFVGKTVRDVMQEATAAGVDVDFLGDGLARAQSPLPGVALPRGERVRVRFAR